MVLMVVIQFSKPTVTDNLAKKRSPHRKSKKAYEKDKKAIIYAKSVEKQSKIYKNQLRECQKSLDKNKYIIF